MRFDVRYETRFSYPAEVAESHNELRACPVQDPLQTVLHYDVRTTPSARVTSYVDYWGTRVDAFGIRAPHRSLHVLAEATVDISSRPPLEEAEVPLAALHDPAFAADHHEFLQRTPHTRWHDPVRRRAEDLVAGVGDVRSAVVAIHRSFAGFTYLPGSTDVGTDVDAILGQASGVCQDYAHLAVALCRAASIPARYVSGYLFTGDDATGEDVEVDEVEVKTHAWFEAAVPGLGWLALDPTNQQEVGERHIVIGRGRDYDDVAPFRGAFTGPPAHELDVGVHLRRLAVAEQQQQ